MVSPPSIPSDWGWLLVLLWVVWQVYAPKHFGVETRFEEIVNSLNDRIDQVGNRLDDIEEKQKNHISITKIMAVETDDVNGQKVSEVLSDEDQIDPDDIVHEDPSVVGDGGERMND